LSSRDLVYLQSTNPGVWVFGRPFWARGKCGRLG